MDVHLRSLKKELFSGWLTKQGGRHKSWKKRWFSLCGSQLLYFKDQSDVKPLGVITLAYPQDTLNDLTRVVHVVPEAEEPRKKHCFEIRSNRAAERSFLCCAYTAKDVEGWVQVIRRVIYGTRGGGMFGTDLREQVAMEGRSPTSPPLLVQKCVECILATGLHEVGIFRLPGRALRIKELKTLFDTGEPVDLTVEPEVHAVASLLKLYLRELGAPLLPHEKYFAFITAVQCYQQSKAEGIVLIQKLIRDLPCANAHTLKYLCSFLDRIRQHHDVNKMTANNLAVVFGPNFLVSPSAEEEPIMEHASLVQLLAVILIEHHDNVFALMPPPSAEDWEPFRTAVVGAEAMAARAGGAPVTIIEPLLLAESDSDDDTDSIGGPGRTGGLGDIGSLSSCRASTHVGDATGSAAAVAASDDLSPDPLSGDSSPLQVRARGVNHQGARKPLPRSVLKLNFAPEDAPVTTSPGRESVVLSWADERHRRIELEAEVTGLRAQVLQLTAELAQERGRHAASRVIVQEPEHGAPDVQHSFDV